MRPTALTPVADARSLVERVIGTFSPERGRPLWERWARYEYQYGDLEAATKLEKRIAEAYHPVCHPGFFSITGLTSSLEFSDPPIKRFAQRHTYLSTDAIASRDLGASMARQTKATGSSGGTLSSPFFLPKSKRPCPRHLPKDLLPQNPESGKNHLVQLRTMDHLPSILALCHHRGIETEIVGMDLHDGGLGQLLGSMIEIEMHPHHGAQKQTEKMKSL